MRRRRRAPSRAIANGTTICSWPLPDDAGMCPIHQAPGTVSYVAAYTGDDNYQPAQSAVPVEVLPTPTAVSVTAPASVGSFEPFGVTAKVTAVAPPHAYEIVGTAQLQIDGTPVGDTVAVDPGPRRRQLVDRRKPHHHGHVLGHN